MIERRTPQILDVREILAEGIAGDESSYYRTQHEILLSRGLAIDVIRNLGLDRNPAFVGDSDGAKKPGLVASLIARVKELFPRPGGQRDPAAISDPSGIAPGVIESYKGALEISPVSRTRLVAIRFSSPDPALAAKIANAHVRAYIQQGLRIRSQASEDARRFLEEKLVDLKDRLEKSEIALNAYRREKGIVSLDERENIVVERLSDLNRRLSEAEAERITREADVKLIQRRDYDSLPGVANNSLIQSIKGQLAEIERQHAETASQFKPTYPAVEQIQAQVREMRARLGREVQRVVSSIESAFLAAADRENELRKKMDEQKAETLKLKDAAVQYAILQRETDANRQLYDSILQRMKEIGVSGAAQASNVSVIDEAPPPRVPSAPKKRQALLVALLGGLGIGVAFVLGRAYLDSSISGPEDVERYLRLPSLGVVPDFDMLPDQLAAEPGKKAHPRIGHAKLPEAKDLVLARSSFSVVTESYRTLRTAILFSQPGAPPQSILFTSAMDGEGKTTSALNMAIVFAKLGARVLIIDADLRRAACHERLGLGNLFGLTDLITGQRHFDEVVQKTPVEGLSLISAGAHAPNPTELLGSRAMAGLLATAAEKFDYVVLDSPPVMAVNDAVVLSPLVDGVVLVVKSRHMPRKILQRAEARLAQTRAKILGVLLNRMDAHSDHYSTYYGGKYYSSYYHRSSEGDGRAA